MTKRLPFEVSSGDSVFPRHLAPLYFLSFSPYLYIMAITIPYSQFLSSNNSLDANINGALQPPGDAPHTLTSGGPWHCQIDNMVRCKLSFLYLFLTILIVMIGLSEVCGSDICTFADVNSDIQVVPNFSMRLSLSLLLDQYQPGSQVN